MQPLTPDRLAAGEEGALTSPLTQRPHCVLRLSPIEITWVLTLWRPLSVPDQGLSIWFIKNQWLVLALLAGPP